MNDRHCPVKATTRRRWMLCLPNLAMLPRCRRKLRQPKSATPIILPDELIVEIMSWLPVKTLMKLRCVNKFFKTTISDRHFVQMHLNKSSRNSHVTQFRDASFITVLHDTHLELLDYHHSSIRTKYTCHVKNNLNGGMVVGSCNGLICFIWSPLFCHTDFLCFWNPAIRTRSKTFATFGFDYSLKYSFGYDNSAGTYKVVAFHVERGCHKKNVVKVFTLGDNSWRDIQCFPVLPMHWFHHEKNNGVYLSGTVNWLALRNYFRSNYESDWFKGVSVEQYVIVSLDLSTESYTQMLLPSGFVEVPPPCVQPTIVVLTDCLCFGHDLNKSHFVTWLMKDFGVQESWVQLFKISYQTFNSSNCIEFQPLEFLPLYLSKNGNTIIFATYEKGPAFVYNCIDNKTKQIRTSKQCWWWRVTNYIESLVPTR